MQELDNKELSREFVDRNMLEVFDEAVNKKRWGELHYTVVVKNGMAQQIKRWFEETLTSKSYK